MAEREWWTEFFQEPPRAWDNISSKELFGFTGAPDHELFDMEVHQLAVEYGLNHDLNAWQELHDLLEDRYGIHLTDIDWEAFGEWYDSHLSG